MSIRTTNLLSAIALFTCSLLASTWGNEIVTLFSEDFEGYADGTTLAQREPTVVSVDGWSSSIYFSGDRRLFVSEGPSGTAWDSDVGNFIEVSNENLYYKTIGTALSSVESDDKLLVTFTEKWYSGVGSVHVYLGNSSGNAFRFVNSVGDFAIYDAAGTATSPSGSESPGQNVWTDVKLLVDLGANGGDGSLSMSWKRHDTDTWTTTGDFSSIDLNLSSTPAVADPTTWNLLTFRLQSSEGGAVGDITIVNLPEPASACLLLAGALIAVRRRK